MIIIINFFRYFFLILILFYFILTKLKYLQHIYHTYIVKVTSTSQVPFLSPTIYIYIYHGLFFFIYLSHLPKHTSIHSPYISLFLPLSLYSSLSPLQIYIYISLSLILCLSISPPKHTHTLSISISFYLSPSLSLPLLSPISLYLSLSLASHSPLSLTLSLHLSLFTPSLYLQISPSICFFFPPSLPLLQIHLSPSLS